MSFVYSQREFSPIQPNPTPTNTVLPILGAPRNRCQFLFCQLASDRQFAPGNALANVNGPLVSHMFHLAVAAAMAAGARRQTITNHPVFALPNGALVKYFFLKRVDCYHSRINPPYCEKSTGGPLSSASSSYSLCSPPPTMKWGLSMIPHDPSSLPSLSPEEPVVDSMFLRMSTPVVC